mgnify:FL=1
MHTLKMHTLKRCHSEPQAKNLDIYRGDRDSSPAAQNDILFL